MLLGAALVLVGGAVLYFAVTGRDPRTLLEPGGPRQTGLFIGPSAPDTIRLPGPGGLGLPGGGQGTRAVKRFLARFQARFPGHPIGRICGPGTVECSEHPGCNAVDIPASGADGDRIAGWAVLNAPFLRIGHVIWNRRVWSWNLPVWHAYTGPSPHTDHVHLDFLPATAC